MGTVLFVLIDLQHLSHCSTVTTNSDPFRPEFSSLRSGSGSTSRSFLGGKSLTLKCAHSPYIFAGYLQIDADPVPDPAYHFDADSDPDPTF